MNLFKTRLFLLSAGLLLSGQVHGLDFGGDQKFDVPIREHSIIVTKEGYYPDRISIFEGERVRFFVTNTMDQPSCLLIPTKELFLSASKGKVSEGVAYFEKPGVYKFYCPSGQIEGKVTVIQKKKDTPIFRKTASLERAQIWMPKDTPFDRDKRETETQDSLINYGE